MQVSKTGGLVESHGTECIRENDFNTLPENITCAFKNNTSFIKLEKKPGCSYYLEARKKNPDFISNLNTRNLSNQSIITYKIHDLLKAKLKTNVFLNIN